MSKSIDYDAERAMFTAWATKGSRPGREIRISWAETPGRRGGLPYRQWLTKSGAAVTSAPMGIEWAAWLGRASAKPNALAAEARENGGAT